MRLEGNFYSVIRQEQLQDSEFEVEVKLYPEHEIYNGHFPLQPIVPGVCTLTVIKECLEALLKRDVVFDSIKECKFLSALSPKPDLTIKMNLLVDDNNWLKATVMRCDDGQVVLKLRAWLRL